MPQRHSSDVFVLPANRSWTVDDLERLPDDGNRYEIANGSLLVTPPPSVDHGMTALRLFKVLAQQAPGDLEVVPAWIGVKLGSSAYIPDMLVAPVEILNRCGKVLAATDVLLVVEVLSPSNRRNDLVLKLHDYADAGIPSYWIVDPPESTITIFESDGQGKYEEREVVQPGMLWQTDRPFPLTINPSVLR